MAKIAVVGCGGIGGLAGFYMARAGEHVVFIDSTTVQVLGNRKFQRLAGVLVREAIRVADAAGVPCIGSARARPRISQ